MKHCNRLALSLLLSAAFLSLTNSKALAQTAAKTDSIFEPVMQSLKQKTRVPLRLPTYLANEEETSPLYANVEKASASDYSILIDFTEDCNGATACHYGRVTGQAVKPGAKHDKGKAVKLANGITGHFVDAKCERICGDSELSWDANGYRYTVGIKAEKEDKLIKVANSAIESIKDREK